METYQPIYDAVRSKISNGDIGAAVETAVRDANLSHYVAMIAENFRCAAAEQERPCVLFRPSVGRDGNQWCALYGDDLMHGVAGFGDTPAEAMHDFDKSWRTNLLPPNAGGNATERSEGRVDHNVGRLTPGEEND